MTALISRVRNRIVREYSIRRNERHRWLRCYISQRQGFFVEAGANDGIAQSNTRGFEKDGWHGLLIEPVPSLAKVCENNRPKSQVECCALVPPEKSGESIHLTYCGLMSVTHGAMGNSAADKDHVSAGLPHLPEGEAPYDFEAPGLTLTQVFKKHDVSNIDFLSLDVEGYEAPVLQGLDFNLFRPKYILIEARFRRDIEEILLPRYELIAEAGDWDVLYRCKQVD